MGKNKKRGKKAAAGGKARGPTRAETFRRELEFGRTNAERQRKAYRDIMTGIRLPAIKGEAEKARYSFERAMDARDHRYK